MSSFMQGATMLASLAVCVFFLRYWRDTGDRLFAVLAMAFGLFAANRVALSALGSDSEARTWAYLLRAAAFLAIIAAVVDKSVQPRSPGEDAERRPGRR